MIGLPSSPACVEVGLLLQRAADEAQAWIDEYHRLVGIAWELCDTFDTAARIPGRYPKLERMWPE